MKIFISDLHLGDGSRTDDFHRDEQFLEFLEFVESQAQELIILGDLFELWQADFDRVLFRHSKVINKLLSLKKNVKFTDSFIRIRTYKIILTLMLFLFNE